METFSDLIVSRKIDFCSIPFACSHFIDFLEVWEQMNSEKKIIGSCTQLAKCFGDEVI
jgi:hypothetical protein